MESKETCRRQFVSSKTAVDAHRLLQDIAPHRKGMIHMYDPGMSVHALQALIGGMESAENEFLLHCYRCIERRLDQWVDRRSRHAEIWAIVPELPFDTYYTAKTRWDEHRGAITRVFGQRRALGPRMRRLWGLHLPERASRLIGSFVWGSI